MTPITDWRDTSRPRKRPKHAPPPRQGKAFALIHFSEVGFTDYFCLSAKASGINMNRCRMVKFGSSMLAQGRKRIH